MDDEQIWSLESPEEWDFERAEAMPSADRPLVVIAVTFDRDEFMFVSEQAERAGMRLTDFVRAAALGRLPSHQPLSPR